MSTCQQIKKLCLFRKWNPRNISGFLFFLILHVDINFLLLDFHAIYGPIPYLSSSGNDEWEQYLWSIFVFLWSNILTADRKNIINGQKILAKSRDFVPIVSDNNLIGFMAWNELRKFWLLITPSVIHHPWVCVQAWDGDCGAWLHILCVGLCCHYCSGRDSYGQS